MTPPSAPCGEQILRLSITNDACRVDKTCRYAEQITMRVSDMYQVAQFVRMLRRRWCLVGLAVHGIRVEARAEQDERDLRPHLLTSEL